MHSPQELVASLKKLLKEHGSHELPLMSPMQLSQAKFVLLKYKRVAHGVHESYYPLTVPEQF